MRRDELIIEIVFIVVPKPFLFLFIYPCNRLIKYIDDSNLCLEMS